MNGNHQRYSGYASGTGGAAEIRLPPKLGLYTIAEKEEEYSDDADGNQGTLKMSGTPSQKSVDGGVPSSQRVSNLQTSNKSGTLYGSAPDMSSASFQKSEETEHVTKSDFTMQPLMTSTPRQSLEQLAQTDVNTELNREEEGSEPTEEQLHDYDNKHSGDVKPSEEDELSERGTKNAQHESDSHVIPSMLDKQSADSETPFSFDDIPVELRPYISMDFDPTFMDDPECREEVYEIARQKMKAKETEQKAAKLCNDLTARSGLPKISSCPLGVRDSFDCDLSAADILKRKQDPMVHSDSSKKGLSTSAFALSTVGGISKLTRKESDDRTVTKEKGSKNKKKRSVDLKPSDLLKKKLKSEVKQAMVREGSSQKQSEIIAPSGNTGPNDKQVSSVGNFHSESVTQQRHTNQALIAKSSESKGYGEADFTNPSELLMHLEIADSSPGYEQILYTTPSSLLQKTVDRHVTENNSKSPGYGNLDYATPSLLLKMTDSDADDVEGNSKSSGHESIDYTTPSELLRKTTDRGITEESSRSPGYGSIDFTTPSQLVQNKESVDMPMEHTTPSKLLRKTTDRGVTEESSRSPGYGIIDYTTPSQLVQNKESVDMPMEHTTPSKLLRKTTDRGVTEESSRSPGYGIIDYTTPSQLVQNKEPVDMPMEHTTPSKLLRKTTDRGVTEESSRSPGYGSIDYTTPSQLVQNKESVDMPMEHTTPSKLLRKTTDRGVTEESSRSPGYGSIDYTTPSQLVQNKESVDMPQEYTTPSKLLRKITDRGISEESSRSPGYGSIDYTTPSQLVQNKESVDMPMEHTTPSKLLRKITDRGISEESSRSPGYGSIDYTTPSQLVHMDCNEKQLEHSSPSRLLQNTSGTYTTDEREKLSGYWECTTPSQLGPIKKDSDATPSEISWNGTAREIMEQIPKSPENEAVPTELLKKAKEGVDVKEMSKAQGYGELICSTPSVLLQKMVEQEVTKQYREHLGNLKTADTELYRSYDSENFLKPGAPSMSTASPLSNPSSYQRSLLSGKQESSVSLLRNPSFLFDSSSEESTDEESMIDNKRISEKKVEETSISSTGYGTLPSIAIICSGDPHAKVPYEPEMLPGSVQSLNEQFWNLCMSSPDIRRFIHENETSLFADTSPSSFKSLEHCTNSPECTCMQCTSKTSIASQRESTFGRSHVTTRQSSRLPVRQKRPSKDGISGQNKKTLPNVRSTTPEARSFIMEKEVVESQNRKLQMEVSTLQTENKLLKDKNNRCQAKINDLEEQLAETKEALESLHTRLTQELSEATRKIKSEAAQEVEQLQNRITSLTEENDSMKYEVTMLEKKLESSHKVLDKAMQNSEKNKTLEAYKMEVTTLKDEVIRVKSLLEQSERHLQEEEQRSRESSQSLLQLTEVKNLLQQQLDMGGGGVTAVDKQIKSLEKRLRVTEERLHQERADRANNLSEVEDKLLTENARLQAVEKELSRQLQREKDKNRNLDHKVKDIREENEKLRLSLPFDESALTSQKTKYDIPHGVHSSQRTETVKNTDYKHVISQVEQETGQQLGQEKDIVCYLWNTREDTYHQLQQQAFILQDLNFGDITEGLKNLRDVKSQSDAKVQQLEEKVNDLRSEKATFEVTYKEQLTALVKERHDAFARLKTAEDLMEAIRSENEILKSSLLGQTPESLSASTNLTQTGKLESLQTEMMEAERKNQQLMRSNILLEGEISTLKVQLEARDKALEEAKNEAELAHRRLVNDEEADRKQQKIDKLTSQVSNLQAEVKSMTDKFSALLTEKNKLENDLVTAHRELSVTKVKVKESKVGEMADSKQNQILKEEIEERDRRYRKLSQENDNLESQLQQVRQDLYAEQIQTQEYESQLEGYQQQLEQRGQMLDILNGTEREQLAQFQILKDTMDSVSQELSQKQAQNKILQLELDKEKDKYEYMERELNNLRQDRKEGESDRPLPSHQLQIRELEKERDHLKSELLQASKSLEQAAERHTAAENEIKQLQRELAAEKGKALQLSTEKGELEQNLEEIAEEHDALVQEKAQNEEDIFKLEQKLEEVIQKLEMEFRKHTENFTANNSNFPPEAIQMVEEIESLRSLLDTKAAEEDALKRRISRQQVEMDFLQRRVELLHNENECNRDDIMRMTGEVMTKMKEGVAVREMNQFLVKERDRLLKDNSQLENNIEKERGDRGRRKAEIADVIRKVEKSDDTSKMTSRDLLQKDAIIASLQAELQEVRRALQQQETENGHLRSKSEHLSKDIQNLSSVNTSLENRLEAERSVLEEEKSQSTRRRDELMSTSHELELLKHDHHITLNTLNAEKQTVEVLKENVADLETENQKRKEEVHSLTMELESHKSQLATSKEAVDNLKQDKGAIYHEYDSMVRKLHEKDEKIEELQAKCDHTVETMQKELTLQKHSLEKEKTSTEHDLEMSREEITSLNEEMKQKEAQLNTFGRTLQELEETTRQKRALEVHLEKMESTHSDSSLLLESMRKETMSLQETIARQQETLTQAQGEKAMLQDQLKIEKEKLSGQVLVLNKENTELRSQTEGEKSYLKDSLVSTQLRLSSVEASLSSVTEARDKAQINNRMLERSLEETKDQYQAETTCRKVAEQRAESLQSQLNETRKDKFLAEEKLGQAQSSLTKLEKELSIEKDRVKHLNDKTQELEATSFGHESSAKAKQDQIALLQSEVGKMRQILESQKQQLNSKLKKTTLEKRQQIEILEEDRIKLTQQNQSLMSDLDLSREQVADKNKDNLRLQERILSLEEEMREQNSKLKQATDAVKAEEEMQAKLTSRFQAQEEELQKMKSYVSKKAEESGGADKSMWVDLNRLVQDLSHQLQDHLEMQTSKVGEQKDQESHTIKKYRKQCQDMESELNTEKALHTITKNSLQALEEDCQRLRHQLHAMRRRDNTSSDKKYKNRMEAINEIIARSQAQAQAMLAASGYYDHTGIKSAMNSPRVDLHCSPDNSVASDISFNSTGPMGIPPYQGAPSPPKFVSSPRK